MNKYAVSIICTKRQGNTEHIATRLGIVKACSEEEAIGIFVKKVVGKGAELEDYAVDGTPSILDVNKAVPIIKED